MLHRKINAAELFALVGVFQLAQNPTASKFSHTDRDIEPHFGRDSLKGNVKAVQTS